MVSIGCGRAKREVSAILTRASVHHEVAPGAPEKEDRRVFGTAGCSVWLKAAADWLVPPHNNNDGSKTF